MNVLIKREQSERAHFAKQEKGGMKFKFKFKIQQYQTDAVEQTVSVFAGQPSKSNAQYRRDLGKRKGQITFDEEYVGWRNNNMCHRACPCVTGFFFCDVLNTTQGV